MSMPDNNLEEQVGGYATNLGKLSPRLPTASNASSSSLSLRLLAFLRFLGLLSSPPGAVKAASILAV